LAKSHNPPDVGLRRLLSWQKIFAALPVTRTIKNPNRSSSESISASRLRGARQRVAQGSIRKMNDLDSDGARYWQCGEDFFAR